MNHLLLSLSVLLLHFSSSAQWTEQTSNTSFNLNDVFFTSDSIGMAVGDNGRLIKTIDGGSNWVESNQFPACNAYAIHFATPDSGWVAGSCGIYFTSNGGLNWTHQTPGNGKVINDIFFFDKLDGWAVGNEMTILSTTDGGINWSIDTLNSLVPGNPLLAVYFRDANNGWIGGGEKLHFTSDGGLTWTPGSSLLIDWIYSIDFGDNYAGVGAGMAGSATYTFDWGTNWDFDGSITANYQTIYGVDFSSPSTVYSVGQNGLIYFSSNAGSSWTAQNSGVTHNLNAVHFPSSNIGYAVGDQGTIIKYGAGTGNLGIEEDYPAYPNPTIGLLNIQLQAGSENVEIRLKNSMGTAIPINVKSVTNTLEIDIETLPTGAYILEIVTPENRISKRIFKI